MGGGGKGEEWRRLRWACVRVYVGASCVGVGAGL